MSDNIIMSDYDRELREFAEKCIRGEASPLKDTPELLEAFRKEFALIDDKEPLPPIKIKKKCRPSMDSVFTSIMQDPVLLKPFLESVTGSGIELDESTIQAQFQYANAVVDEQNAVRVDNHAKGIDGRVFAVDVQRTYVKKEKRLRMRVWYYASRIFSSQKVKNMKYEELKSSVVIFVMSDHKGEEASGFIHDYITREYSDGRKEELKGVIDVYEIFAPRYKDETEGINEVLQMFARFFCISNEEEAAEFSNKYGESFLGRRLIRDYAIVSKDDELIDRLNREEYFMGKFYLKSYEQDLEESREEGRQEGREEGRLEGIEEGKNEVFEIMKRKGLPEEVIQSIMEMSRSEMRV